MVTFGNAMAYRSKSHFQCRQELCWQIRPLQCRSIAAMCSVYIEGPQDPGDRHSCSAGKDAAQSQKDLAKMRNGKTTRD